MSILDLKGLRGFRESGPMLVWDSIRFFFFGFCIRSQNI